MKNELDDIVRKMDKNAKFVSVKRINGLQPDRNYFTPRVLNNRMQASQNPLKSILEQQQLTKYDVNSNSDFGGESSIELMLPTNKLSRPKTAAKRPAPNASNLSRVKARPSINFAGSSYESKNLDRCKCALNFKEVDNWVHQSLIKDLREYRTGSNIEKLSPMRSSC